MVFTELEIVPSYWHTLEIDQKDIEFLYTFLLEKETPLPSSALANALIRERIRIEKEQFEIKQQQNGEIYRPKSTYTIGEKIQFPALNWVSGTVTDLREGHNPEFPELQVMTVDLENGKVRQFATNLEVHALNMPHAKLDNGFNEETRILKEFGPEITQKLEEKLNDNKDLIRIGAKWFAKSLLVEFNVGHLNLAEAMLDMHEGGPLTTAELLKQIEIDNDDPKDLVEFSLNYALHEDPRFDEVGPSGEVLWFLNRLEPEFVRNRPIQLIYSPIEYDRSGLTEDMLEAELSIDDELVEPDLLDQRKSTIKETLITLNYPHWRAGSIPLTSKTKTFFPTAIESPRVKFKFIDAKGQEISAWVVRPYKYIYGLSDWYEEMELMPGSIIKISAGKNPGEVRIQPEKKRSNKEWIRTLLIGADGGIVFAMLKQTISADFNERMAIAVPSTGILDELWQKRVHNPRPLKNDVINIMRELIKINSQGQVHAVELYAGLNCIRRCPPGLLFSVLATGSEFSPVGDLYFRLSDAA